MEKIYNSALELVGGTPLVRLNAIKSKYNLLEIISGNIIHVFRLAYLISLCHP